MGNGVGVLSSKLVVIFGLGTLAGCAGAQGRGLPPPGATAIRVINHVAAPGEIDRLAVTVDGALVPLAAIPPDGAPPATIAVLRLAPGPHTIAVRAAVASAPRPGPSPVHVVGAQHPFHVGREPAAIAIDLRSPPPSSPPAAPLLVSLSIVGGSMSPAFGEAPADDKDQRCGPLQPVARALCRAAFDLDAAVRRNDVVAAWCVRDKLGDMRRLAVVGQGERGGSPALAEASIQALSGEVERCAGAYPAMADGLTVVPPRSP